MNTNPDSTAGLHRESSVSLLESLADRLDIQDAGTHAHGQRVAGFALILGRRLGLSIEDLLTVERGVFLHDIGKLHIPDRILRKATPLSDAEWKVMKSHVVTGYAMLSSIPSLAGVAEIVLAHHERYDGTGYPHRLEKNEIPIGARICAVADCLEALTCSDGSVRRAMTFIEATHCIASQRGAHFDPEVVDAFLSVTPSAWHHFRTSFRRARLHRMEGKEHPMALKDVIFRGDFDKPARKVIAC